MRNAQDFILTTIAILLTSALIFGALAFVGGGASAGTHLAEYERQHQAKCYDLGVATTLIAIDRDSGLSKEGIKRALSENKNLNDDSFFLYTRVTDYVFLEPFYDPVEEGRLVYQTCISTRS